MFEIITLFASIPDLVKQSCDGDVLGAMLLLRALWSGALVVALVYEVVPPRSYSASALKKNKKPFRKGIILSLSCLLLINHLIELYLQW